MGVEPIAPYLEPLRKSIFVAVDPARAFAIFTNEIGVWWPRRDGHSVFTDRSATCGIQPYVGGEVFEESVSGERAVWGRVLRWEPGVALELSWHPGRGEETGQTVRITFIAEGDGTRVNLEHRDWQRLGPAAESTRARYGSGWENVLATFRVHAAPVPEPAATRD